MGRHVNYADEQDRWINKADKINRSQKHIKDIPLEDRDPGSLTLKEQFELARKRKIEEKIRQEQLKSRQVNNESRISHYRPK